MLWPPPPPGRVRWAWLLGLPFRRWRLARFARLLDGRLAPGAVAIDVGSGPGYAASVVDRRAAGRIRAWVLLDPQRGMLLHGREWVRRGSPRGRLGAASWAVADAARLPLRDGSADLAVSVGVFCCMEDSAVPRAAREAFRTLRRGGYLLFAVPRWRGEADEKLLRTEGFTPVASRRAGRSLFRKPL